jgi:3-hydroxyacyl-CoA dehydrogenase
MMGNINAAVNLDRQGDCAVIAMDSPPVNALGAVLREGLAAALAAATADATVARIVLTGTARAFSGGADITEFGKSPSGPGLHALIATLEDSRKPTVAVIQGVALGGGLELALGCHYRVAFTTARLGLPEIKLGLLPGAGGTQRLPRIVGVEAALGMIISGDPVRAEAALKLGLIDAIVAGNEEAIAWAAGHATKTARVQDRTDRLDEARANPELVSKGAAAPMSKARAIQAAQECVAAVRAAVEKPFAEGLALEREAFGRLVVSDESKALRHVFFAEREANKIPGQPAGVQPRRVLKAAVIGAGTMGGGISMNFANVGIDVTIIETSQEALDRGLARVDGNYATSTKRGSITAEQATERRSHLHPSLDFAAIADADLIIEAVFEEMELKKEIFRKLDAIAKPGAILASNTSMLDINEIAAVTSRPQDVLGMHFFSPANVMKLLEVVRGDKTSPEALATAVAVGRIIAKVPVVVGVCYGFVGNRMLGARGRQSEALVMEGALPHEVDRALTDFGFRMGPFAMSDLAGLDVGWRLRKARGAKSAVADALCEAGRFGQKTGAGYYTYADGRTATPDPEVERLVLQASADAGVIRRAITQEEILERLVFPMINEGARILEEGIAARAGDIDVIWLNGYGWPAWRGGPMFYGELRGLDYVAERLNHFADASGDDTLRPAPLLAKLAASGEGFGK